MRCRCALIRERRLAGRRVWFRRICPSGESGFGAFRPGEGLLRGPPSGEGPFTGHSALPAPSDSHVSTNAVPITMSARPMPPRRATPVASSLATSVRFCSKRPSILTWSPGFWAVFRGRCSIPVLPTWGNAGAPRPLGSIPPAKPPRSRIEASPARRNKRGARNDERQAN